MSESPDDNLTPIADIPEVDVLRERATQMGIKFHPNSGVKKLSSLIDAKLKEGNAEPESMEHMPVAEQGLSQPVEPETEGQRRARLTREAGELVRVRVTNMNPNKKEWEGEIYTVSNSVAGTFRKYVPFNAEDGWHVPKIMLDMMKEKECQVFYSHTNERGVKVRKGKIIKELAIEYLDPLTSDELKDLAASQAARHAID